MAVGPANRQSSILSLCLCLGWPSAVGTAPTAPHVRNRLPRHPHFPVTDRLSDSRAYGSSGRAEVDCECRSLSGLLGHRH
jgi:hypothetical protein